MDLEDYLKAKKIFLPFWFKKVLECYGVDLVVVKRKLDDSFNYRTMKNVYKETLKFVNKEITTFSDRKNDDNENVNIIAIDRMTKNLLGFVKLVNKDDCLYLIK